MKYLTIVSMALLITSGCVSVGPDYVAPHTPIAPTWHTQLMDGLSAEESATALACWWTTFNDAELSSLIDRATRGNLDLQKAQARIREARARRGIAEAGLFPTADASASATWSHTSPDTGAAQTDLYAASFDAVWELDIFGGIRRSVEAASADLEAVQENLRNMLVSLLAEVALNYFDVRTYQVRLTVAEANLESQAETYQLTQWRYEAGLSDELSMQQARYNLENTRSQIPVLRTGLEAAMNRIAVLLGEQPGMIHAELEQREPVPVPPLNVAVGVPADALRRRPDVRQAERELAAQTARIGVAVADLYPKFSLTGSIGLQTSSSLSATPTSPNGVILQTPSTSATSVIMSGGPQVSWAIFKGGAIRQNIEVQSALQEQALIKYEATVLAALEEAENALVAYAEQQERTHSLTAAVKAARNAVELAQHKYQAGLADFTSVLDAQRSLLSFQEQLAQSNGNVSGNLVRLYKALGGGWTSVPPNGKR